MEEVKIMANMSYCRFQNTVMDLQDCYDSLHEMLDDDEMAEDLSSEELRAKKRLIQLCKDISFEFEVE